MSGDMVQTRCACGHSAAAHRQGPCEAIDVFGLMARRPIRSAVLCVCDGLHDTYVVPAADARKVARANRRPKPVAGSAL